MSTERNSLQETKDSVLVFKESQTVTAVRTSKVKNKRDRYFTCKNIRRHLLVCDVKRQNIEKKKHWSKKH